MTERAGRLPKQSPRGRVDVTLEPVSVWAAFDAYNSKTPIAIHADDEEKMAVGEPSMTFTLNLTDAQFERLYDEFTGIRASRKSAS